MNYMICKTQKAPKVPTCASTAMTVLKTNITSLNQSDRLHRMIVNGSLVCHFKIRRSLNAKGTVTESAIVGRRKSRSHVKNTWISTCKIAQISTLDKSSYLTTPQRSTSRRIKLLSEDNSTLDQRSSASVGRIKPALHVQSKARAQRSALNDVAQLHMLRHSARSFFFSLRQQWSLAESPTPFIKSLEKTRTRYQASPTDNTLCH
jgi:hypothetical protein